jgi:hypothetical protein
MASPISMTTLAFKRRVSGSGSPRSAKTLPEPTMPSAVLRVVLIKHLPLFPAQVVALVVIRTRVRRTTSLALDRSRTEKKPFACWRSEGFTSPRARRASSSNRDNSFSRRRFSLRDSDANPCRTTLCVHLRLDARTDADSYGPIPGATVSSGASSVSGSMMPRSLPLSGLITMPISAPKAESTFIRGHTE